LELDDFVIRVVDGRLNFLFPSVPSNLFAGPSNTAVTEGPHASAFEERIGKTHYVGQPVPPGNIWQAKGVLYL